MRLPCVIGHRGARGLFPENTLEGFQAAAALGCHGFELDVGLTKDDVAVVSHDLALNPAITRDASGCWLEGEGPLIRDLTRDELKDFDVGRIRPGTLYRRAHRGQTPADGARIPTLEAVLSAHPNAYFIIELKTDPRFPDRTARPEAMAEAVVAIIDQVHATARVTIESFDWRGPRHILNARPELPLALLTRPETERDRALWWDASAASVPAAVAAQAGATTWAPAWDSLTAADVHSARDLGLSVLPWTVNQRTAMRRLIAWGVDGLITDRPDIALGVTRETSDQSGKL